ncbi:glycosyltransferase [Psychroserpens sp. MEBiC05023]
MDYIFTIIVPVYNEEDNLKRLANELINYIKTALVPTKVLFVNDCSTDNSQVYIEDICSTHHQFDYIIISSNQGLSTALKAGFDMVSTPLVGYMDADLQTTPNDFNLLLEHIHDYDMVTGIRTNRKDSFIKSISSKIANRIRRFFTNDKMLDTGCPLKVIKTDVAKSIPMFKGLHRFLPAMILLQKGTIKQIPVRHFPRIAGTSKFGVRKRIISPLLDCFAYVWMKKRSINYTIDKKSI